ncbi:hypothetical protein [Aureliella helgolandensis]|uniref:Uncharacterized protein n=1 Tax=Aureliella helgolandensis TaxID=2527968 RepID=A0A518G3P3_9BACT|nr:hypothetical protein [Aureliella helgolandensis]QDV23218.1 hypothetical protein Q31a_15160 [Aureliella helgolandensis]
MKPLLIALNSISGLMLIRFTISKFAAWPVSVAAFVDMAKPLGIDPTFFRISTGFVIGYAAISFFTNSLILLLKQERNEKFKLLFTFNSLYATGAMTGALFSEFFLRSNPKWLLVYIATGIVSVAVVNLLSRYSKIPQLLRKNSTKVHLKAQSVA